MSEEQKKQDGDCEGAKKRRGLIALLKALLPMWPAEGATSVAPPLANSAGEPIKVDPLVEKILKDLAAGGAKITALTLPIGELSEEAKEKFREMLAAAGLRRDGPNCNCNTCRVERGIADGPARIFEAKVEAFAAIWEARKKVLRA